MFSKTDTTSAPPRPASQTNGSNRSVFSSDLRVTGEVSSLGTLEVLGEVDGNVTARGLIIGAEGRVSGTVQSETIEVRGQQTLTDLTRVVYSSCNLCERDPSSPPLWQVRARTATQDSEAQRIAYRDAQLQIRGIPVLYSPFFSHPDPQSPRGSRSVTVGAAPKGQS